MAYLATSDDTSFHLITSDGGSIRGRPPSGPLPVGMADWEGSWGKTAQTGGRRLGRLPAGGNPVGLLGNDLTRAAWDSQLDPTDHACRKECATQ